MAQLNMSSFDVKERVEALHENLEHALSCLSGMQQPLMSTDQVTKEDECMAHMQMEKEMYESANLILSALYGENGKDYVFKLE